MRLSPFFRLALSAACVLASARSLADEPRVAAKSFQTLVDDMDRHYSYFTLRGIDWRKLAERYRRQAEAAENPEQFAAAITPMLTELEDLHVWIEPAQGPQIHPYQSRYRSNGDWRGVLGELRDVRKLELGLAGRTRQGFGYVAVTRLRGDDRPLNEMLAAVEALFDAPAMIIDLRRNSGGSESMAARIAALFADRTRVYARSKYRSGPGHDDFYEGPARSVRPRPGRTYARKIVCLIGPGCVSSGEGFVQMLKVLPQVTLVGQPTRGASGNPAPVHLPNGLRVWYSRWVSMLPDGTATETRGIPPDILINPDGPNDSTFRAAIKLLTTNHQPPTTDHRQLPLPPAPCSVLLHLAEHVDAGLGEAGHGGVGIFEAEHENRAVAHAGREGVHVLDVDPRLLENPEDLGQAAGAVGHFDGQDLGHGDGEALLGEHVARRLPIAHDEPQDAELPGVGQREREQVDARLGQGRDRGGQVARLVLDEDGDLGDLHASFSSVKR